MTSRITVQGVENLFRKHFSSISISIGDAVYRIENYHPNGMVQVLHVFGGIQKFIEKFIPYVETYHFEESVRNEIIDKDWIQHTLERVRDNDSLERTIREALTDPDGNPEGRLCRFVVAMLGASDQRDVKSSIALVDLTNQPCLEPFRGQIHQIADDLCNRGIIAIESGSKYRLRVLIPLFSRGWWQPERIGW